MENKKTNEEILEEIKECILKNIMKDRTIDDEELVRGANNIDSLLSELPFIITRYLAFSVESQEAKDTILYYLQEKYNVRS